MTKQEKIEKIKKLLEELGTDETIEETITIPRYALMFDADGDEYRIMFEAQYPYLIPPKILAHVVGARIPNATWAAVNVEGDMHWYAEEPESLIAGKWHTRKGPCHSETGPYRVPCVVENWKSAIWRVR